MLPIFYKVSTESVKQLVGEFGDHFRRREWEYRCEKSKIDEIVSLVRLALPWMRKGIQFYL